MKNRMLSLALALVLCLGLTVPVLAEETEEAEEAPLAAAIPCDHSIGIGAPPAFHDGLACTWETVDGSTKYGFMDKTGEVVIPCRYDAVHNFYYNFSEGLAAVRLDGKWGFIDRTGEMVIPCQYDAATSFSEGLAGVQRDGKCGFIDKTGREVIPCTYSNTSVFCEGLAGIEADGKWGFIDKNGEEIVPCQYDGGHNFSEGLALVVKGSKCGFIDQTGQEIIPCKYSSAGSFSEGLAAVERNGKWGFINKEGEEVIPCKYGYVKDFSEGLAMVELNDKRDYIDRTGAVIISCHQYSAAWSFSEGFAAVQKVINGYVACGYIDKTGKEVVPCKVDSAFAPDRYTGTYAVSDGMAPVVILIPAGSGGGFRRYGYLAVTGGREETPEPAEVTAQVSDWARESVDAAAANRLIADGLGDDYRVNITRAQFAAVAVKLYEAMSGEAAPAAGGQPLLRHQRPSRHPGRSPGLCQRRGRCQICPGLPGRPRTGGADAVPCVHQAGR